MIKEEQWSTLLLQNTVELSNYCSSSESQQPTIVDNHTLSTQTTNPYHPSSLLKPSLIELHHAIIITLLVFERKRPTFVHCRGLPMGQALPLPLCWKHREITCINFKAIGEAG